MLVTKARAADLPVRAPVSGVEPAFEPHVDGPRVAHPVARLEDENGCAGRGSLRERYALTSLFAPRERDGTRPVRFLNRASEVRILPGAQTKSWSE